MRYLTLNYQEFCRSTRMKSNGVKRFFYEKIIYQRTTYPAKQHELQRLTQFLKFALQATLNILNFHFVTYARPFICL